MEDKIIYNFLIVVEDWFFLLMLLIYAILIFIDLFRFIKMLSLIF